MNHLVYVALMAAYALLLGTLYVRFGLADEALEDTSYDSQFMRDFLGVDLSSQSVPDATTLLKFRRLLEDNQLTVAIFAQISVHLQERGLMLRRGTTIVAAPSSTKNAANARDPEMHQTRKGNQWFFGMKAHIGADADSGLVHSVHATAANESDIAHTAELLHGQEEQVFADAGYTGVDKRAEVVQAVRLDLTYSGT